MNQCLEQGSVREITKVNCSTQTISCLKDDTKSIKIAKESFENKLLQQREDSIELNIKMKYKTELGEKQTILSTENKDEVLRFNELRELLKSRAKKKERTISYLEEDITALPQLKEYSRKQLLAQRDKTGELTIILKADIASGNN